VIGTWMFGTPAGWAGVNKIYFGRVRQLVAERDQWGVSNLKMLCSPDQDSMQDVLDVANSSLFIELTSDDNYGWLRVRLASRLRQQS